jgi:formylglycine-generating enzyme required for sulfatase activity
VTCVSWSDAKAFCDWLTSEERISYALPTEAQWEFACRAGSMGQWSLGDGDGNDAERLEQFAWLNEPNGSHPVAQKQANAFGLFDLHGNVWEWCADWFAPDFYSTGPSEDPLGGTNGGMYAVRVLRGGSHNFPANRARSAHRNKDAATAPAFNRGFRVVIVGDLDALKKSAAGR